MILPYCRIAMGTFELELPDGMEEDIESHIDESNRYTSKSELIRDAVRHRLESRESLSYSGSIRINQQQIDHVEADSLDDVKSEQEK
jgi:Arc/MetJ-type ribon-helix-helix transcriptional regulator